MISPLVDLQLSATSLSLSLIQYLLKSKKCNRNVRRRTSGEGLSATMSVYPHVHPQHSLFDGCWRSDHLFIHHISQLLLEHILPFGTQFLNTKNTVSKASRAARDEDVCQTEVQHLGLELIKTMTRLIDCHEVHVSQRRNSSGFEDPRLFFYRQNKTANFSMSHLSQAVDTLDSVAHRRRICSG